MSTVEVYYSFQVRASNLINRVQNYGELSQVTPQSTVFVPSRGKQNQTTNIMQQGIVINFSFCHEDLPIPRNVQVTDTTNSTATLTWDYPEQPYDPITNFKVEYQLVS